MISGFLILLSISSQSAAISTDSSGKITMSVWSRQASTANSHFTDFKVDVGEGYVAIGGGILGTNSGNGNFVTASYPSDDLDGWLISSKDHGWSNPVRLTGYAIGLKIEGLTSQELKRYITVTENQSDFVSYPDVSVSVALDHVQIGGGARIEWYGQGNMLTASYPTNSNLQWRVQSKEHIWTSHASAHVYSIGLLKDIPGVGEIEVSTRSISSGLANHPASAVNVATGHALSSCGASVNYNGYGNMLWKIQPRSASGNNSCSASSKDLNVGDRSSITTYALGIKVK